MKNNIFPYPADPRIDAFLAGKSEQTLLLVHNLLVAFNQCGPITLHPAKTMIGIDNGQRRIAWITQLGKNFVHVVFPFSAPYTDNLCFQKIAQVPGRDHQFNHHLRICYPEDINEEVLRFMHIAYNTSSS